MSWWLNYYLITYAVSGLIGCISGPWMWKLLFTFGDAVFAAMAEIGLVCLVCVVGLDMVVGKKILFGGSDDMLHPIWWSWYAVIMLLFNLAKGAALAASRILYMQVMNFCQFAIIDKTTFPTGYEGMDPAYSSFVSLVYFTSKYRNPLITSLCVRFQELKPSASPASPASSTATDVPDQPVQSDVPACIQEKDPNGNADQRVAPCVADTPPLHPPTAKASLVSFWA